MATSWIGQFGVLPGLLYNVMRALVSAIGRAAVVLNVTIAMLVLNAFFAYALVLGHFGFPAMGLEGAAIVSVVVQAAGFLFIVAYVQSREETRRYEIFVRFRRPDWKAFWEVVRLGLPIGITILAEVSLFTVASLLMGHIGMVELDAHGISLQWCLDRLHDPARLVAGGGRPGWRCARARFLHRCSQGLGLRLVISSTWSRWLVASCSLSRSVFWAAWFLDTTLPKAPQVLAYAGPLIVLAGLFSWSMACRQSASGLLRGLKDVTRVPMIMALVACWSIGCFLPGPLRFPLGFGGISIWFGFLVGLAAAAVMLCETLLPACPPREGHGRRFSGQFRSSRDRFVIGKVGANAEAVRTVLADRSFGHDGQPARRPLPSRSPPRFPLGDRHEVGRRSAETCSST